MNNEQSNNERVRISKQRDSILDIMTEKFRDHIANDRIDDAMVIADEYFEWLHPNFAMKEDTLYADYDELRRTYKELTS
tara:strand:+ start:464 stop:700 length:237 start_codon:yes stop_codon:yes gene_type:complete